jgi:hypothetical protein
MTNIGSHAFRGLALVLAIAAGLVGCTTPRKTEDEAVAFSARHTNEKIVLSWQSVPGQLYTVLYTDQLVPANWEPLHRFTNIEGTGTQMQAVDDIGKATTRFYRLHTGPYQVQ